MADPSEEGIAEYINRKHYFEEVLYLSMKYMSKCMWGNMSNEMRMICCKWATMALNRIGCSEEEYGSGEMGRKGSASFNYFHAKKWSAKYLYRFIHYVMTYHRDDPERTWVTKQFYNSSGANLRELTRASFESGLPASLNYHLLNLADQLFQAKPTLMPD